MIKLNTSEDARWSMALDELVGPMQEPKLKARKASKTPEQLQAAKEAREAKARKAIEDATEAAKPTWKRRAADFVTSRFRDLALAMIVLGAGIAVFDGSFYSASAFMFIGWSAYAFAVMPDALMVLSAAKMREQGITPTQTEAARKAMRFGLWFSMISNMIAALLRSLPGLIELHVTVLGLTFSPVRLVGSVVYHGVVVLILLHAVEVLTKVRADRKGHNGFGSMNPIDLLANVAKVTPKALGRNASSAKVPAQRTAR